MNIIKIIVSVILIIVGIIMFVTPTDITLEYIEKFKEVIINLWN